MARISYSTQEEATKPVTGYHRRELPDGEYTLMVRRVEQRDVGSGQKMELMLMDVKTGGLQEYSFWTDGETHDQAGLPLPWVRTIGALNAACNPKPIDIDPCIEAEVKYALLGRAFKAGIKNYDYTAKNGKTYRDTRLNDLAKCDPADKEANRAAIAAVLSPGVQDDIAAEWRAAERAYKEASETPAPAPKPAPKPEQFSDDDIPF